MHPLHPVVLDRQHLRRAWPLVQMAAPATTLKDWLDYGRRQVKGGAMPRRGLFALACDRGYFYGLAAFQRSGRLPAEIVLDIRLLGQAGLAHARTPLASMTDAMIRLARLMQCSLVRLKACDLPAFITPAALVDCGFVGRGEYLERRIDILNSMEGKNLMTLRHIRLELARDADFPEGSRERGYEFNAPLTAEGHLDADAFRAQRAACTVRRFWPGEDDRRGTLHHTRNHAWVFSYAPGEDDDEAFHRLDQHLFRVGDYVTIREPDERAYTYRVVSVR